ncbi:MAG: GNAT family N-acetyltransferase [Candidatus Thermoplasmatota archaeon]|nr:GNAT family N-acetyltransferase [Candidatus Thermoplasmatota archaeon]
MAGLQDLYRLDKSDIKKGSEVLARAFFDDPDMMTLIPDPLMRRKKLPVMFVPFLRFGILYGEVYSPSRKLEGVSFWIRSEENDMNLIRSARSGFISLMFRMESSVMKRFSRYGKEIGENLEGIVKERHWFLFILGVDPEHQKSGYGKMMLEPMLERIDRDNIPILLDTSKEKNVPYYERFGFEVKKRYKVLDNDHWGMVRKR